MALRDKKGRYRKPRTLKQSGKAIKRGIKGKTRRGRRRVKRLFVR